MLRYILYPAFGLLVLTGYGYYTGTGRILGAAPVERRSMPPGARSHGGFRAAPIFWYGGYSGGK